MPSSSAEDRIGRSVGRFTPLCRLASHSPPTSPFERLVNGRTLIPPFSFQVSYRLFRVDRRTRQIGSDRQSVSERHKGSHGLRQTIPGCRTVF
jgi:hypothetical protein